MAHLILVDTGYLNKDRVLNGTMPTRANNGNPLELEHSAITTTTAGSAVDSSPQVGVFRPTEINYSSIENKRWEISVNLHCDDEGDQTLFKHLCGVVDSESQPGIERTEGLKVLYISGVNDTKKTVLELQGSTSTKFHGNEVPTGLPGVVGRVKNVAASPSTNSNVIRVTFTFIES